MPLADVILNQLDNQLGISDPGGKRLALIADASAGDYDTPTVCATRADLIAYFTSGKLVEDGAYLIEQTGKPIVAVRSGQTTQGAVGTVTTTGGGTSVITADASIDPVDDYELKVIFDTAGTIGLTGILYRYSLDDGRDGYSVQQSLGTAVTVTLPGPVKLDFAAGTILAGEYIRARTSAPKPNQTQLGTACEALRVTENDWWICISASPAAAVDVATLDTAATACESIGKERFYICAYRVPIAAESEATYLAAFQAEFSASVSAKGRILVCSGAAEIQSPISQRRYLRSPAVDAGAAHIVVRPGQDISWVGAGPRPAAVRIKDAAGNAKHHDELMSPGLEDARSLTYRTWHGERGVFFGNPRLMSATGSDFMYSPARLVMNLARETTRAILQKYSSADLLVDRRTGFILESVAAAIDGDVNNALEDAVITTRNASDAKFRLSRTDNMLSTFTLRGDLKVTPLAYAKHIIVDVGFFNPALRAVFAEAA